MCNLQLLGEVSEGVEVGGVSVGKSGRGEKAGNVTGCEVFVCACLCAPLREGDRERGTYLQSRGGEPLTHQGPLGYF